ncbi:hypothetical protein XENOCAPTIV_018437 [Xenoophorus captivus]|uniref:Uncharacterized protein n=1 Tax=Xenoophorus captivus TaxID=1517983 RepID=A0ABV0R136_9TELE
MYHYNCTTVSVPRQRKEMGSKIRKTSKLVFTATPTILAPLVNTCTKQRCTVQGLEADIQYPVYVKPSCYLLKVSLSLTLLQPEQTTDIQGLDNETETPGFRPQ